jgi:5-methylcytosine-specific restriction endonuclease McrA
VPYKDPEVKKLKHREYSRKHYELNKKAVIEKSKKQKKAFRTKWMEFKQSMSCTNCGFDHPAAIDFHHVNPAPDDKKLFALLRRNNFSAALKEVEKCVPLCANCHRLKTHLHNDYIKKVAEMSYEYSDAMMEARVK